MWYVDLMCEGSANMKTAVVGRKNVSDRCFYPWWLGFDLVRKPASVDFRLKKSHAAFERVAPPRATKARMLMQPLRASKEIDSPATSHR